MKSKARKRLKSPKVHKPPEPRVLLFDIETSPWRGWYYDQKQPYCILETDRESHMLSFAWKWLDEKKIHCLALPDFRDYRPMSENDYHLVSKLHSLISEADVIVGHNGDSFDLKYTNARLMFHGFDPPTPYQTFDTLKAHRRVAKSGSNRLDALARFYGFGRKTPHHGKDMFLGCVRGDKQAWAEIKKYNPNDVYLLERLYLKVRPWVSTHPNLSHITRREMACKACQGTHFQKAGYKPLKSGFKQRYQCTNCWTYNMGELEKHKAKILT